MKTPSILLPKWKRLCDRENGCHSYETYFNRSPENRRQQDMDTDAVELMVDLFEVDATHTKVILRGCYISAGHVIVYHENTYADYTLKQAVRDVSLYQRNLIARVTVELQRQARRWEELGRMLDRLPIKK